MVFDEVWVEAGFLEIFEKDSFVSVDYKGQNRSVIDGPCVDTEWFVEIDAKRFEHRWKQGEEFVWGDVWRGDGCFSPKLSVESQVEASCFKSEAELLVLDERFEQGCRVAHQSDRAGFDLCHEMVGL